MADFKQNHALGVCARELKFGATLTCLSLAMILISDPVTRAPCCFDSMFQYSIFYKQTKHAALLYWIRPHERSYQCAREYLLQENIRWPTSPSISFGSVDPLLKASPEHRFRREDRGARVLLGGTSYERGGCNYEGYV